MGLLSDQANCSDLLSVIGVYIPSRYIRERFLFDTLVFKTSHRHSMDRIMKLANSYSILYYFCFDPPNSFKHKPSSYVT